MKSTDDFFQDGAQLTYILKRTVIGVTVFVIACILHSVFHLWIYSKILLILFHAQSSVIVQNSFSVNLMSSIKMDLLGWIISGFIFSLFFGVNNKYFHSTWREKLFCTFMGMAVGFFLNALLAASTIFSDFEMEIITGNLIAHSLAGILSGGFIGLTLSSYCRRIIQSIYAFPTEESPG